ncbi:MAG TPA: 50S ribosomal protein L11 methyltransferase [Alphaproteobacteria bacterium]|nr:50S ribosomal protein L11 methyltransferase [Alphaproteobacteria bacterium]
MKTKQLRNQETKKQQDWPAFLPLATGFIRQHSFIACPPLVPEIELHLAESITPLWRACEDFLQKPNVPPPFWSVAWPGGQALARLLLDGREDVKGKRVLDFASGSGLVAFAAAKAGAASVTANDVDPLAIAAIGLNAQRNNLDLNVLHDNLVGRDLVDYDLILAGDFCYEWPMAGYAVEWLRAEVKKGRRVIFADPGRPHAPRTGIKELWRVDVPASLEVEDAEVKNTGVFRLLSEG